MNILGVKSELIFEKKEIHSVSVWPTKSLIWCKNFNFFICVNIFFLRLKITRKNVENIYFGTEGVNIMKSANEKPTFSENKIVKKKQHNKL